MKKGLLRKSALSRRNSRRRVQLIERNAEVLEEGRILLAQQLMDDKRVCDEATERESNGIPHPPGFEWPTTVGLDAKPIPKPPGRTKWYTLLDE
mmetsp:Transcript_13061/g.28390  ORF Transcript_13061/g.28390 Transcript_13061/m.28390 type:complete len:94 (-) Transcript_13061:165-446(-)